MLRMDFESLMMRLCINYERKTLSNAKIDLWYNKTREFTGSQMARAVEQIIEQQERFPALSILLACLDRVSGHDAQDEDKRRLEQIRQEYTNNPPDPEYEKAAMELANSAPYLSKEAYCQAMKEMDGQWPGRGWLEEAESCLRKRDGTPPKASVKNVGEVMQEMEELPF